MQITKKHIHKMKLAKSLKTLITLLLISVTYTALAAPNVGPSDPTSPPPPTGTADKIICYGQNISINGPQDAGGVDYPSYQWYKIDPSGTAQLTTTTTRTYTETTTDAGYYNYQVVTVNASGCTSPSSDIFKVFVLPALTATITTNVANNTICSNNQSSIVLTANPSNPSAYTYNYQWTNGGVNILGATSNTYTLSSTASGTLTIGVNVTYALNTACATTATQVITVSPVPGKPAISAN
jgi:hypothetical protein